MDKRWGRKSTYPCLVLFISFLFSFLSFKKKERAWNVCSFWFTLLVFFLSVFGTWTDCIGYLLDFYSILTWIFMYNYFFWYHSSFYCLFAFLFQAIRKIFSFDIKNNSFGLIFFHSLEYNFEWKKKNPSQTSGAKILVSICLLTFEKVNQL